MPPKIALFQTLLRDWNISDFLTSLYSPGLNPIELTFSYIKQYLQEHQEIIQAANNLSDIIKSAFNSITINQCINWIGSCGYN